MLAGFKDKRAIVRYIFDCYSGSNQTPELFEGCVCGTIVPQAGGAKFAWDAIFQPDGSDKTFAEMTHSLHSRESRTFSNRIGLFFRVDAARGKVTIQADVARLLKIKEVATTDNFNLLNTLVSTGHGRIFSPTKGASLSVGDTVERSLRDGDIVILNQSSDLVRSFVCGNSSRANYCAVKSLRLFLEYYIQLTCWHFDHSPHHPQDRNVC